VKYVKKSSTDRSQVARNCQGIVFILNCPLMVRGLVFLAIATNAKVFMKLWG
jgi:hypothetical protein